jgi:hypothetical protein
MNGSDRAAIGCIALIIAAPIVTGGAAAAYLATRPAAPPPIAEPPSQPTSPPSAATPVVAPVVETTAPAEAAPAVPIPAAPTAVERTARAVWDAKVVRAESSTLKPGTRCTLEATVASSDMRDLRLASGLTVRCGAVRIYHADVLPPGASTVAVREVASMEPGRSAYVLELVDDRVLVDTPHGRASVVPDAAPAGIVSFVVAGQSRPMEVRLVEATPAQPVFFAGRAPSPAKDDEVAGRVVAATGDTVVEVGARCRIGLNHYGVEAERDRCYALVVCGAVTVIGRPERFAGNCRLEGRRVLAMQDLEPASVDRDPALDLDQSKARVWNDIDGSRWSVTIALDPRR